MSIPVIDMSALFGDNEEEKLKIAKQIDSACRKNGFFQISNHGIDLTGVNEKTLSFFKKLSQEEKMKLAPRRLAPGNANTYRGYTPADVSGKETFDIGSPAYTEDHELIKKRTPLHDVQVWPESLGAQFRHFFEDYFRKMLTLSKVLLRGFALALGKDETFFDDKINLEDTITTLRLNYYPFLDNIDPVKIDPDGTRLGCIVHKDSCLVTILLQEIKGLQVEDSELGWIDVEPSSQNFVVNTGQAMSRWTNNTYKANNHRVKFENVERVSVPFFVEPGFSTPIESFTPSNSLLGESNSIEHPVISYGEHVSELMKQFSEYTSTKTDN